MHLPEISQKPEKPEYRYFSAIPLFTRKASKPRNNPSQRLQDGTTMTVTVALSAEQSISVVNKSPCVPCLESALFSLGLGPPWPITVLGSPRKY